MIDYGVRFLFFGCLILFAGVEPIGSNDFQPMANNKCLQE
jgi:hypothetical protein